MATVTNLVERMNSEPRPEFVSAPRYYRQGDYLNYFISPNRCYAHRVDSLLTIYTDVDDPARIVGCKVKGVRRLMATLQALSVIVSDGHNTLALLFLSLLAAVPKDKQEEVLKVAKQFAGAPVNYDEILKAAA